MDTEKCRENGKKGAALQRERAEERYYADPNICKNCGNIILLKDNVKVSQTREKKFCDRTCAAQFNNRVFPKRVKDGVGLVICTRCGAEVQLKRQKNGGYYSRKYCETCLKAVRVEQANSRAWHDFDPIPIEEQTKSELKSRNHNSYLWWSNKINKHAFKVFERSGRPKVCKCCGYSLHTEVCHIRDINQFPDSAKVKEINDLTNLVTLCRNCHWEFDHGFLKNLNLNLPKMNQER